MNARTDLKASTRLSYALSHVAVPFRYRIGLAVMVTSSPNGSAGWLGAPSAGAAGPGGVGGAAACGQEDVSPASTSAAAATPRTAGLQLGNIVFSRAPSASSAK